MVDVTVNAPPKPQLPYDESVIPDAVKKRAAAVDALYSQQSNGSDGASQTPSETPEPSPLVSEVPAPQEPAVSPLTEPAPADTSTEIPQFLPKHEPEKPVDWERRFLRMQGQYNASQKLVGEMQEQLTQLGNEVLQLQRMPQRQAPPPPPYEQPPVYLSEQDRQNYGDELIDFTTRAAAQASQQVLGPKLQEIERQNVELQRRLAEEARQRLDQQLELAVPNFREIDRDPRWHKFLLGVDLFSGRIRQQLLNEAIASASAPRVISFFRGFLQEEVATGHSEPTSASLQAAAPREPAVPLASLAAPGRARPATGGDASLPPDKPTYTRAQIAQLYAQHRRGAYVGREAEWARQDADIIAAAREGRVR